MTKHASIPLSLTAPSPTVRLLDATVEYQPRSRRHAVHVPFGETVYVYDDKVDPTTEAVILFEDRDTNHWWGEIATTSRAVAQESLEALTEGRSGKACVVALPGR